MHGNNILPVMRCFIICVRVRYTTGLTSRKGVHVAGININYHTKLIPPQTHVVYMLVRSLSNVQTVCKVP